MEDFKTFGAFLNEQKDPSRTDINQYSWDELNGYSFTIYPHNIMILTNANENEIVPLWREYYAQTDPKENFDGFLQLKGYVAISGCKSKIRPLDNIAG
jgi:hypothetical protein